MTHTHREWTLTDEKALSIVSNDNKNEINQMSSDGKHQHL